MMDQSTKAPQNLLEPVVVRHSLGESPARPLVFVLAGVVALAPFAVDMYLPALPALRFDFGASASAAQFTLTAYFVGLALGQLFYGPLSDRFGRKLPLLMGMGIFVVASGACAFSPSMKALILLRFVQAMGGCAGMVITRAILRDVCAPRQMARVLSLLLLLMGLAPMVAPLLGGLMLHLYGWRLIFLALTAVGALVMVAVTLGVSETHHRRDQRLDGRIVLGNYAWLLSHRRFMGYALAGGVAQGGLFAYLASSSFIFIDVYGLSPMAFAALFGLNAFGLIAAAQVNRYVLERVPGQRVLRRAIRVYAASGLVLLSCALTGLGGVYGIAIPLWLCVSSLGFSFPNTVAAAMAPFGDRAGYASALLGTLQFAIATASSWLAARLYDGSAVPLAALVAGCGVAGVVVLRTLVGLRGDQDG